VAVYNIDEHLTPVLLTPMHTCFMSHLLVLVSALVLVLLQLVLTATLLNAFKINRFYVVFIYRFSVSILPQH